MFEFFKELGPVLRQEIAEVNRATGVNQYESDSDKMLTANGDGTEATDSCQTQSENGEGQGTKEKRLLSKTVRTVIVTMGIIFLITQAVNLLSVGQTDMEMAMKVLFYVKAIILSADVIATFVFLKMKGRKAEILAISGVLLFIVLQYLSTALMMYI